MTVKDYLKQAFTIDRLINVARSQIEELEEKRLSIGSLAITGDRVQASPNISSFTHLSDLYIDSIERYISEEKRLLELKSEIKTIIDTLANPTHRLIMSERYISCKIWETIAADNGYSWQGAHKIHDKALVELEKSRLKWIEVDAPDVI